MYLIGFEFEAAVNAIVEMLAHDRAVDAQSFDVLAADFLRAMLEGWAFAFFQIGDAIGFGFVAGANGDCIAVLIEVEKATFDDVLGFIGHCLIEL